MQFDALVFDLDGTLWDAAEGCAIGWNQGLRTLNIDKTLTADDIRRVTGNPTPVCVKLLLPDEAEHHQRLLEVLGKFEEEAIKNHGGKFYDGLPETMETLSRRYDLYLVSNCQAWYLDLFLKLSGIKRFLKGADCFGLSHQNKPEMLQKLKKECDFSDPAYIGDTEGDETSSRKAGYSFIHAAYGFGQAKAPDFTIHSLKELGVIGQNA
jgi:phosphoglycolate phosphatase